MSDHEMDAYENPTEFVQDTQEVAEDVLRKVEEIGDFFFDGGPKYQREHLANSEQAFAAAEGLLNRLAILIQAQARHIEEKEEERRTRKARQAAAAKA